MSARTLLLSFLGLLAACGPSEQVFVGGLSAPVIYGEDDRREVFNHPSEDLRSIARSSIVALIPTSRIDRDDDTGRYQLFTTSLKTELMVSDELVLSPWARARRSGPRFVIETGRRTSLR